MVNSVSGSSQIQPTAQPATQSQQTTQSKPASTQGGDTVQLSSVAQAAFQETTENPAQTAKEAIGGDQQAQTLLAREAAQQKLAKGD